MTSETAKAKSRLSVLASSFDDLEDLLEPLFSQSLPENLMGLESIQQAKLQTLLPYLVYDLIFIYLKTRGIDPKSHPVISELDRVRQYFGKVANAETAPDKPATKLDKNAAGRFIKHAIAQVSKQLPQDEPTPLTSASPTPATSIPAKVTSKMLARADYQRQLREEAAQSSDEEGLQVINDTSDLDNENSMDVDNSAVESSKRILGISTSNDPPQAPNKRKRPTVDPFAGIHIDLHV
ncbi:Sas10/Utp3/C1D family domain containing protein [Amanita muscaria]